MPTIAELLESKKKAPTGFDPEGSGYDMESALKYGLKPDPNSGHWQSRIPQTGLLLKGKQHKTWDLLEKGEEGAEMEIYKGEGGRYYSRPKKQKAPTIQEMLAEKEKSAESVSSGVYGPSDVWTSPSDSDLWKGPGARFTKGVATGAARSTLIPRLLGKDIQKPETTAGKAGEITGSIAETIIEYLAAGGAIKGIVGKLPKAATAIDKALRTGLRFGGVGATRQARKGAIEAIHKEDAGYEGGTAILKDFAFGAILSLAVSGIGATGKAIWGKLRPTEHAQALKLLGLKKGASEEQIMSASRKLASKYHPDKVKGMVDKFKEVIKARETLRPEGVVRARVRPPVPKQISGLSEDKILMDVLYKHGTAQAPTATEKINPASLRSIADLMHKKVPRTSKGTDALVKTAWDRVTAATKQKLPKPLLAPESLEEAIGAAQLPQKPPSKPVQPPKPEVSPVVAKQPWEMTFIEYRNKFIGKLKDVEPDLRSVIADKERPVHKAAVVIALQEGKPVPAEVLAEYPDLAPVSPAVEGEAAIEALNSLERFEGVELKVFGSIIGTGKKGVKAEPHDIDIVFDVTSDVYFNHEHPFWEQANALANQDKNEVWIRSPAEVAILQAGKGSPIQRLNTVGGQAAKSIGQAIPIEEAARVRAENLAKQAPTPAEPKPLDEKLVKGWLPKVIDKLSEQEVKNLSDAELERAFKGAVAEKRLTEYAKLMRESGDLKYSDVAPAEPAKTAEQRSIEAIDKQMEEYRAKRRAAGLPVEKPGGAASKAYKRKMAIIDKMKPAKTIKQMVEEKKKAETPAQVVKSHKADILPKKSTLLADIDAAITKAPEAAKDIIHFDINGGANISNDKRTLKDFRDRVAGMLRDEARPRFKPKPKRYRPVTEGVALKKGKGGLAVAQSTEQLADNLFAELEQKISEKKPKGSLASILRKLEGSIPQSEWQILDRELEDYSKWNQESYENTVKLYRSVNKRRLDAFKPKPVSVTKPPAVSPEMARRKGGIMPEEKPKPKKEGILGKLSPERLKQFVTEGLKEAKMTKAEMGQVELEPTEISGSEAVNKHIDYFEGIQLPDTSKIRPIQREIRRINGKRLSGKITAQEANKRIRALKTELFGTAIKEGVSVRTTKRGGKAVLSLRKAGTYVPEDFSKYAKFKDIQPLFGGGQDITRAVQQMDGSLSIKQKKAEKGQAGPIEKNVLWRTRDISKQKLEFIKEQQVRLRSFLKVKPNSKNDTLVNNVLRQIKSGETLQDVLKNKKVLAYTKDHKIIKQAVELRDWYDDMIDSQNALRQLRDQAEIPYRGKYSPEIIRDATIWERVMAKDKKPREIIQGVELPDYIKPNKPFNPRELARDAGIPYEERVKSATQLARNYLVTASKDIFNTSIIQNNKAFIQQLEAMGYEKSAGYLSDWTAEAYAGVKPKLDRAVKLPHKVERAMRRFNQARNIAIFPLNFAWNLTTQPSSLAFTFGKYGTKNTFMGFIDWMKPSVRAKAAKDYYSYIVKSHKAGRVTRQDVMNLIGENVAIKRTKGEMVYDVTTLMINEMEKLLTGMSIQAAHRHGKAKGLTGKALQEYASDGGGKTQSMYNDEDRPALLRSLGVKTLTPFQTFNYETVNNLREWAGKTGTPPENNKVRVAQIVRFIAAAAVFRMIAKKLANKDIYTWDRMPIPFAEYWFSPIVKGLTGKEYSLEYNLPSPVSVGVRIGKGLKDVYETGSWQRLRRELVTYGTGYLNIPGGVQINRTVEALIAYSKGGVYDRKGKKMFDVEKGELKQAIFGGVYSTKGGKKYIEKKEGKKESKYPKDF